MNDVPMRPSAHRACAEDIDAIEREIGHVARMNPVWAVDITRHLDRLRKRLATETPVADANTLPMDELPKGWIWCQLLQREHEWQCILKRQPATFVDGEAPTPRAAMLAAITAAKAAT